MSQRNLIITSIADSSHPVLQHYAKESASHSTPLIVIGDTKSPASFQLTNCDFYSIDRQKDLPLALAKMLPPNHYARKNLGYLIAISKGAEIIIETDDDNFPYKEFWTERERFVNAYSFENCGWINAYKYFTDLNIWPRGFALEHINDKGPALPDKLLVDCPIQQGLADQNPDVDAIYRLTLPLPVEFNSADSLAFGRNSFCPFNSQNTTWFDDAFPLLYLPSYCSFRMTDIWRSFIAQRIAWECNWKILFHQSTVWQKRNDHNLMHDFKEEMPGYLNNNKLFLELQKLNLKLGKQFIPDNLITCYEKLIDLNLISSLEMPLLLAWLDDIKSIKVAKYK